MANNLLVPNVFYTAEQYVDPVRFSTPQTALVDEKLIYPLIKDAGNYQLAIGKAQIPMDTIPLTRSNIPLKRYELTLRQGNFEASAYLRQLNSSNKDFLWNCSPAGIVDEYTYSTNGTTQFVQPINCSTLLPNGVNFFCVDDFRNGYFATPATSGGLVNQIKIINLDSITVLASLTATQIKGMDLDRGNRLYVADEGTGVKVYSNENSASEVVLSLLTTITTDFQGNTLTDLRTICVDQTLLVGYNVNKFCLYNITTFVPYTGFTNTNISSLGKASSINSSGQGSFIIVDDNTVNGLFLANSLTTQSPPNVYNLFTEREFGSFTTPFLPSAKYALTDNGYGFGVGNNNKPYVFTYNSQTAQPTGNANALNENQSYSSACCLFQRTDVAFTGLLSGTSVYGLNLDNQGNNNIILYDNQFSTPGSQKVPLAWDFQLNSKLTIAIDQTNKNIYRSSQCIYPKDFFQCINLSETTSTIKGFGVGWNDLTPTTASVSLVNSPPQSFKFTDMCPIGLNIFGIGNNVSPPSNTSQFVLFKQNGTPVSSFASTYTASPGVSCCSIDAITVAVLCRDGTLLLITASTGVITQTLNLSFTPDATHPIALTGGQDVPNASNILIATNGFNVQVFKSSNSASGYVSMFTSPIGLTNPQFIFGSLFFGAGFPGSQPTLYLLTNGANPSPLPCQALLRVAFTPGYAGIDTTNCAIVLDGQQFWFPYPVGVDWGSTMSGFFTCGEIYIPKSTGVAGVFSNQVIAYNPVSNSITSTMTFPATEAVFVAPPLYMEANGNTQYYTWNAITFSGIIDNTPLISIACARDTPNTIYVLDDNGVVYRGNLPSTAPSVVFSAMSNVITPNDEFKSISVFPDTVNFNSFVSCYSISNQTQIGQTAIFLDGEIPAIARNDVSQNYSVSVKNNFINFYNSDTFVKSGQYNLANSNLVYTKAGQDIDAGLLDIYNFQVFVDALNVAFAEAYNRLKTAGGSLTSAPTANIDFNTQLFTLNYSSDYPQQGNGIIFNNNLLRIVQYYALPDTIDVGFFKLVLPPSSTSLQQTNKSAYKFNKLNKILFQSTTLYVSGSFVGINAQNQTVTDVDVITDNYIDNLGQTLYYQPNFLRPFVLGSNNPIDRVQLSILYSYIDGTQHTLTINPDDGWSVLFDFIRKS